MRHFLRLQLHPTRTLSVQAGVLCRSYLLFMSLGSPGHGQAASICVLLAVALGRRVSSVHRVLKHNLSVRKQKPAPHSAHCQHQLWTQHLGSAGAAPFCPGTAPALTSPPGPESSSCLLFMPAAQEPQLLQGCFRTWAKSVSVPGINRPKKGLEDLVI